jgi:hypothetical protein
MNSRIPTMQNCRSGEQFPAPRFCAKSTEGYAFKALKLHQVGLWGGAIAEYSHNLTILGNYKIQLQTINFNHKPQTQTANYN